MFFFLSISLFQLDTKNFYGLSYREGSIKQIIYSYFIREFKIKFILNIYTLNITKYIKRC